MSASTSAGPPGEDAASGEGTGPKIGDYVDRVSGVSREEDGGRPDHTYAKSSIWRPQNYLVEPCRYLFMAHGGGGTAPADDAPLDVETTDEEPVVPLPRRPVMPARSELVVAMEDDATCWSDRIPKVGWSPVQVRILPRVLHVVEEVRLHRLAYEGRPNEQFHVEEALSRGCSKLAGVLAGVGWDRGVTQWLHALLTKHLSPVEREDYLSVLALVARKTGSYVNRMTAAPSRSKDPSPAAPFPPFAAPRLDERVARALLEEKFARLPRDPVFLVVPNSYECTRTERFATHVAQLRQMASRVEVVSHPPRRVGGGRPGTVQQGLDQYVAETRAKLADLRSECLGRPLVTVGWNLGAAAASLLARLEPVQAVVCLGYPLRTVDDADQHGRSCPEPACPVLFVVGARALRSNPEEIEELRSRMRVPNRLVVVGGCDDRLIMARRDQSVLRVTQSMVDRALAVEIYNFVGGMLTRPPPPPPPRRAAPRPPPPMLASSFRRRLGETCLMPPTKIRKVRATNAPAQKLIVVSSAKYVSLIPHHNYAAQMKGCQRGPPN